MSVTEPLTDTRRAALVELLAREYGLAGEIERLTGENENYLLRATTGKRYVLKLLPEGRDASLIEVEQAALAALQDASFGLDLAAIVPTRDARAVASIDGGALCGRLYAFLDGVPWHAAGPASPERLRALGRNIGRLAATLAGVDHPAARHDHPWGMTRALEHRDKIVHVADPDRRRLVDEAYHRFAGVASRLDGLPRGLVHGDLNDENLLVTGDRVSGLIDFGDIQVQPIVCDLGVSLAYLMLDEAEPLVAGAALVGGYHESRRLSVAEVEMLWPIMLARLAVSVLVSAERRTVAPDHEAYYVTEERAWQALERWLEIDTVDATHALAAATDLEMEERQPSLDHLLERRAAVACGAQALHFSEPIHFVRGAGPYLYDDSGRPYLDFYNNVCHVGHCHPRVVEAGQRQMARLNTNTRYVYQAWVDYAERLCSSMPEPLNRCFVVNSGTEANELALRLAWTHTGRRDLLVVENAYHGHTTTMVDISPYKFLGRGGKGRPEPWVHIVPMADPYRGPYKGLGPEAGRAYGDAVGDVITAMERPPAAFITESLLSCGGQIVPAEGYLARAFEHVRAAGGLCIADEVQVGFGRVGSHFWAFELQDVVPDIVVLGKPIGNGHPMAAVITTEAVARSFTDAGMEFFSTFGGNPVSCAIGSAVLDVIEDEGLQENAGRVGARLLDGLRGLMGRHELIGDVRGVGLFVGVELVRDRETLEPAGTETRAVVDGLRRRGILTGTDGPHGNVIKIKGPMVIDEGHAEQFVRTLDDVLTPV